MGGSPEIWSDYWADAVLHGCTEQFPASTQRSIAARWRSTFAALPADAAVLDLASGRGAVLALAVESRTRSKDLCLVGADLARVEAPAGCGFTIEGGIASAALPYADRSFTLVTSQFGIEYGGFSDSLEEAARVADHALLLLVHAADGVVAQQTAQQAEQADWMLQDLDMMGLLRTHFSTPTPGTAATVTAALRAIAERAERDENIGLLEGVWRSAIEMQEMAATQSSPAMVAIVDHAARQLAGHRDRMRALQAAALTAEQVADGAASLARAGFTVSVSDERSADMALEGRWLDARRA